MFLWFAHFGYCLDSVVLRVVDVLKCVVSSCFVCSVPLLGSHDLLFSKFTLSSSLFDLFSFNVVNLSHRHTGFWRNCFAPLAVQQAPTNLTHKTMAICVE